MLIINYKKTLKEKKKISEQKNINLNTKEIFRDNYLEILIYANTKFIDFHKNKKYFIMLDGYCFYNGKSLKSQDLYFYYKKYNFDFIENCKGSFNIFYYNLDSNCLKIKTDSFGSRLLFYSNQKESFYIASRLLDVLKSSNTKAEISNIAKQEYFYFGFFIQNSKTLFKNCFIFPTNKSVSINKKIVNWSSYNIPTFDFSGSLLKSFKDEWIDAFDNLLTLFQNETFIIPLSAGLDSRAIIAEFSRRDLQGNILAVTFAHANSFELKIAEKVTKSLKIEHEVINWNQNNLMDFQDFNEEAINNDGMIFTTPYIPNNLYRKLSIKADNIWSGFSGDPLMGSHTLDLGFENKHSSLMNICFDKYKTLNNYEIELLNIDFDVEKLKNEIEETTQYFDHLNIIEGFDSWYMQNRNRYTTQCGISSNRDLFEYIYILFCL